MSVCDSFKRDILAALPDGVSGRKNVLVFDLLSSTNDKAKELAHEGAPDGTVVVALSQSAGRGRLGRSFFSQEGAGLYMSVLYRPSVAPGSLMPLTAFTAVAVCDAIERLTGFRPGAKWPNDVVANGKKLCGILAELALEPGGMTKSAVIGIGVNVAHTGFPDELKDKAGSLMTEYGVSPPLAKVCAAITEALDGAVEACTGSARGKWISRYRADCVTIGKRVRLVRNGGGAGIAVDIDDDAALIVRFDDGSEGIVGSGEVLQQGF